MISFRASFFIKVIIEKKLKVISMTTLSRYMELNLIEVNVCVKVDRLDVRAFGPAPKGRIEYFGHVGIESGA